MLEQADNNIVSIARGDSGTLTFDLNLGTVLNPELYTLTDNDTVYLGIMDPNGGFEHPIIAKKYTGTGSTSATFTLLYQEINMLRPQTYYYEVKLRRMSGTKYLVDTIIPRTKFIVTGDSNLFARVHDDNPFYEYENTITYEDPAAPNSNDNPILVAGGTNTYELEYGLPLEMVKDIEWIFKKGLCVFSTKFLNDDVTVTEQTRLDGNVIIVTTTLQDYECDGFTEHDQVVMQLKITLTSGSIVYGEPVQLRVIPSLA